MLTRPKQFTIYRSKWLRGEGATNSALLRSSDQKMCCLGFYALACGANEVGIKGYGELGETLYDDFFYGNQCSLKEEGDLMENNDLRDYFGGEAAREQRIKDLFLQEGIEVDFKD